MLFTKFYKWTSRYLHLGVSNLSFAKIQYRVVKILLMLMHDFQTSYNYLISTERNPTIYRSCLFGLAHAFSSVLTRSARLQTCELPFSISEVAVVGTLLVYENERLKFFEIGFCFFPITWGEVTNPVVPSRLHCSFVGLPYWVNFEKVEDEPPKNLPLEVRSITELECCAVVVVTEDVSSIPFDTTWKKRMSYHWTFYYHWISFNKIDDQMLHL